MMKISAYEYRIESVKRVVDGDTFDFILDRGFHDYSTKRIRLIDIDTPEVYGIYADAARGQAALDFARQWLSAATGLTFVSDKYDHRGKYGRQIGRVFRDGDPVGLGEALALAGHVKDGFGVIR